MTNNLPDIYGWTIDHPKSPHPSPSQASTLARSPPTPPPSPPKLTLSTAGHNKEGQVNII